MVDEEVGGEIQKPYGGLARGFQPAHPFLFSPRRSCCIPMVDKGMRLDGVCMGVEGWAIGIRASVARLGWFPLNWVGRKKKNSC